MIEKLCELLMNWCQRNGRVLEITGTGGPDDVYLIRYYVLKSRWANIFIHQFLRSDRDDLHDHPWNFLTYLVRGAYTENKWNPETSKVEQTRRSNVGEPTYQEVLADKRPGRSTRPLRQNRLVFRRATDQHQVVVDRDLKREQKHLAPLTLFVSGPTKREWGFVREVPGMLGFKSRRWVPWREYLGLPADAKGRG